MYVDGHSKEMFEPIGVSVEYYGGDIRVRCGWKKEEHRVETIVYLEMGVLSMGMVMGRHEEFARKWATRGAINSFEGAGRRLLFLRRRPDGT